MRYCARCEKKTESIYNDFMVEFCAECKTMRGKRADYVGEKRVYQCIHCGRMLTESYVGQTVCALCFGQDGD